MLLEIKIDATVKFTDALSISKEGAFGSLLILDFKFFLENWVSILLFIFFGIRCTSDEDIFWKNFTISLDTNEGSNLSFTYPWLDRSRDVFKTFLALDENQRVNTIINPEITRKPVGVGTFEAMDSMLNWDAGIPDDIHASYDWYAAIGTHIKFTRSFPAKASAKAKVPIPIITL